MADSLWVDELHTSWTIADGFGEVYARAALGNQSPVFFWAQWLITAMLGHSEIVLRSVSWLAANAFLVMLTLFVRYKTESIAAALSVGILMAIDSHLIFYANEARPYALLQLCAMLSAFSCYRYAQSNLAKDRFAWILLTVVSCYLHYTAGLLLFGEFAFLLLARRCKTIEGDGPSMRRLIMDLVVLAMFLLPTTPHLLDIAGRRVNWEQFINRREFWDVFSVLPSTRFVVASFVAILFALGVERVSLRLRTDARVTDERPPTRRPRLYGLVLLSICWFVVPTAVAFALNNTDVARVFFRRYLVSVIPATYLLIGLLISLPSSARSRAIVAAMVVMAGAYESFTIQPISPFVVVKRHSREDWRTAVAVLNANPRTSNRRGLVLLRAGLIEDDFLRAKSTAWREYSKLPVSGIYRLDRNRTDIRSLPFTNAGELETDTIELLRERGEAWLLLRGHKSTREDVVAAVIESTENQFEMVDHRSFGPTLGLYEIQRRDVSSRMRDQ